MSLATIDAAELSGTTLRFRVSLVLGILVFSGLIALLVITAIPYGTAEAWWKAFFVCASFSLGILWLIEGYLSGVWIGAGKSIVLPVAVLVLFSLLQTVSLGSGQINGLAAPTWRAISVDPFETRFFALQLSALLLCGVMLFRYLSSDRRLKIVINVIIVIAVASAIFGIIRQTSQHSLGFGLPLLKVDVGFGQFVNKNHFPFLMEMALGLILGMVLSRGVRKEQVLLYLAALLPIWTALVISRSRGGLIAMLLEVGVAAFLLTGLLQGNEGDTSIHGSQRAPVNNKAWPKWFAILKSAPFRFGLVLVMLTGVVIGTLYLGGERLASSIESTGTEFSSDFAVWHQGASRNEIWATTLKMFAAHPVLGVGMGAYWVAVPAFHDASGILTPQEAHNDYLELLSSGGLVGFAIGVWFVLAVFKKAKQNLGSPNRLRRAACLGACIGIAGVAVHSLVDFGLHMIVNALVFTTLIVIATSEEPWNNELVRES